MKTRVIAFVIIMIAFTTSVFAQDFVLKFEIENKTNIDLFGVYVTQSDVDHWGEDIIPSDLFTAGSIVEVTVPVENNTICLHDIKVTDVENNSVMFESIDFCVLNKLSFFIEDGVVKYTVE